MNAKDTEESLIHFIYTSAATEPFSPEELEELLVTARKNNDSLNITGMLIHEEGSFFQVLEGREENIDLLFDKICEDKRHNKITKLIFEAIEERSFSEWSMGHAEVTRNELANIEGLNDFFLAGKCFHELDNGRAKTLLGAFRKGKWRSAISS